VKLSRVHYASLITSIEKTKERRAGAKRPRLQKSRAEETKRSNEIKTLRDKHSEELTALKAKQTDELVDTWATQRLGENRGNESSTSTSHRLRRWTVFVAAVRLRILCEESDFMLPEPEQTSHCTE
jgi:hypothetical protein